MSSGHVFHCRTLNVITAQCKFNWAKEKQKGSVMLPTAIRPLQHSYEAKAGSQDFFGY